MATVSPVPQGLHTITPQVTVDGAAQAIELYRRVFGAEERNRSLDPSGKKIWHAELRIGESSFFINDVIPEMGGVVQVADLWIYTEKADELFKRAVDGGMATLMPMADQFWGDRTGTVKDRWGIKWNIARRIKDMTPDEMKRAGEAFAKTQQSQQKR
jgi:uncharacterized glyoxalase superfamily protein PhnB